jgi:hypothetical protein
MNLQQKRVNKRRLRENRLKRLTKKQEIHLQKKGKLKIRRGWHLMKSEK